MDPKSQASDRNEIIDEEELLDRVGDDLELLAELVPIFLDDSPRLLEEIRDAVHSGNADDLRAAAHTLKGAVGNFSAYPAYRASYKLEEMGTSGLLEGAHLAYDELKKEIDRLSEKLKDYLPKE
jgi:two-component system, sensor histidine kinase and response regulator